MSGETLEKVKHCLGEVLAVKPDDIDENSSLINDLGADSLDLVELMFVLERTFGIRLTQDDLRLTRQLRLTEEEIHVEEVVTPLALERLRELFPEASQLLVDGVTRRQLSVLLTARHVAASIDEKLGQTATT